MYTFPAYILTSNMIMNCGNQLENWVKSTRSISVS